MNIILSIHPKWSELIYSGKKICELRKTFPKNFDPKKDKVYLYETAPVKKVTGFICLGYYHIQETALHLKLADELRISISKTSCVPSQEILEYAKKGNGRIFFWEILKAVKFDNPFELHEKRAPQSWQYASVGYM